MPTQPKTAHGGHVNGFTSLRSLDGRLHCSGRENKFVPNLRVMKRTFSFIGWWHLPEQKILHIFWYLRFVQFFSTIGFYFIFRRIDSQAGSNALYRTRIILQLVLVGGCCYWIWNFKCILLSNRLNCCVIWN